MDFTINAQEFASMLRAVLPHASKDKLLPILRSVRVEVESPRVFAYATDRFTAAESAGYMERPKDVEFGFTFSADDAKRIVSTYGKSRNVVLSLRVSESELVMTDDVGGRMVLDLVEGNYPSIRGLIHKPVDVDAGDGTFWLNPANVAKLAVRHLARDAGERNNPLRFSHGAPNKPVRVEFSDHFVALLMPVRSGAGEH